MARVRVNGKLLHEISSVSDLEWSHEIDGGCSEASWSVTGFPATLAPHLRRGAKVEVFEGLRREWLGVLSEPGEGRSRECHATGLLAESSRFMAFDSDGVTPTDNLDLAIQRAIVDGWDVAYEGDAPGGLPSEGPQYLHDAILAASAAAEKRATVRADGVLRWETDPTSPTHLVMPGVGSLGRASEDYVTHVVVYYVKSMSGTPPVPDDWGTVTASAPGPASVHGRSTMYVDLTERGALPDGEVAAFAKGLLSRGAARLSFTSGLTVSAFELRTLGLQRPSLAHMRAGQMVRFLGVQSPEVGMTSLDVVVGGTTYLDGSGVISLRPVGLAPRNLADVIASIPTQVKSAEVVWS